MKSRFHPRILSLLGVLPLFSVMSLKAQDQGASNQPDAAPLQIQEAPMPGTMPAPETFAPEAPAPAPADSNAPTPAPASPDPAAPAPDSGMGSPGQNPPPSDPNSLIPPPAEPEQPSPINAAGNEEKQRQDQKTRYYSVKVQADKEEALVSLQKQADKAKSDEAKRQALREYYDLLAKRMKKIDPSLSEWIDTMHAAYLRRLQQVRVEPTIPVNPPPVPEDAATPSPTPKKKAKASLENAEQAPAATPTPSKKEKAKDEKSKPTSTPSPAPKNAKADKKQDEKSKPSPAPKP